MVAVDCDTEQEPLPQAWIWPVIVKKLEVAEAKPGAFAARSYPAPALLICRFPKSATPFELVTVVVPASVPPPGLVSMRS